MGDATKLNFAFFCLLFLYHCFQIEGRFVYRDTDESQGTVDATEPSTSNKQEVTESTQSTIIDQSQVTPNLNSGDVNVAEQNKITSSKPETQNARVDTTTTSVSEAAVNNYFTQSYSIKSTSAAQSTESLALNNPGSKIPRPNGLERDIDDPDDLITHIKPCDTSDIYCNIAKDSDNSVNAGQIFSGNPSANTNRQTAGQRFADNPVANTNRQTADQRFADNPVVNNNRPTAELRLADNPVVNNNRPTAEQRFADNPVANTNYGVNSDNQKHKRFVGSSADADYDDAYF